MKELEKMSYEELNALMKEAKAEVEKRQNVIKKEYYERYYALCEIAKAFQNYCDKFNGELPYIWTQEIHNEPIQVNMVVSHDGNNKHPYLFLYRKYQ